MQKSLIDITAEELKQVTDLAALFFTPREIARMLEYDPNTFIVCLSCSTPEIMPVEHQNVARAYHTGSLQAEVDLRTSIMKLAKSGSSPAQTMALDILNKSKVKKLDR